MRMDCCLPQSRATRKSLTTVAGVEAFLHRPRHNDAVTVEDSARKGYVFHLWSHQNDFQVISSLR